MRKFKIIVLAILLFIISAILLLQIDDDLDPQAQSMYEQAMAHKESEAYIYLLGMQAGVGEKPEIVGKALMASIREADKKYFANPHTQEFEHEDYTDEKRLPLPELGSCIYTEKDCEYTDKLFDYSFNLESLPEEQKVLLKRYKKLIAMRDFHTLPLPHIYTPLPTFQYLTKGNTLASLEAIEKAKKGNLDEAKKLLLNDISLLRFNLQQADTLITKIIYVSMISKTLDVLSALIHKYDSPAQENIKALTSDEKSLVKAMDYEYGLGHNLFKSLDRAPNLLSTIGNNEEGNLPAWVSRILYKPNMTMNATFPALRQVGQDSLLTSKAFTLKVASDKPISKKMSIIRNYAGTILWRIAGPDFNPYIARVFALDAKIHLFNKTANQTKLPATLSHINNPFYDDKAAYYSEDKKAICVDAPLLDKRKDYRCLRIK
ncbi:MAG: hypothetical protein L3J51_10225 [Cocleimonas sp.]|nr:hypothetical protein [Cocleimonas sp.]